ncbi:MAG: hypothetical protein JWM88_3350, partial [Verrucomicrobia bacterium]|nr:hypothetical protein [Verrucomicrobiota bacterium]
MGNPLDQNSLASYLWAARGRFRTGVTLAMLRSLAAAPCTLLIQLIVDKPLKEGNIAGVIHYSLWFVLCLVVHYGFSVWGARSIARTMSDLVVEMRSRIFFRLQFL